MWLDRIQALSRTRAFGRSALALALGTAVVLAGTVAVSARRVQRTTARLADAAQQMDSLTAHLTDDTRRAAIAWGYSERLRLGLESPFRLVETAALDQRLPPRERRTVSWALLSRIVRGESNQIEPSVLDGLTPAAAAGPIAGDEHLALITDAIVHAADPRAAELAIRLAYTLALTERVVSYSAPAIVAEVAALVADREIARREGIAIVRTARVDPIQEVGRRRAHRALYLERPVLMAPDAQLERDAIGLLPTLLANLRAFRGPIVPVPDTSEVAPREQLLAADLRRAGAQLPPASALAVTVQRYLPTLRGRAIDTMALRRATNAEMLVAALHRAGAADRETRRLVGRLLLAAGVAMRSSAQDPVVFATDTTVVSARLALGMGLSSITFDRDVPAAWRPHLLASLTTALRDLRRVLPAFELSSVNVRFRMSAPADSALAMHDPRSRTLHLPAVTGGGTLAHELAHELDRQSAIEAGLNGYRSDAEARPGTRRVARSAGSNGARVAASLRALTDETSTGSRATKAGGERPAEIFATRVDWFLAHSLARQGITSGYLTGVQDETLTGHVVHPERLRATGRSRSLLDALEGMTTVAPRALEGSAPSLQTLLRWSLSAPVDRGLAARIVRGTGRLPDEWPLIGASQSCTVSADGEGSRVALLRLAAESRARGWLRQRAIWMSEPSRPAWARGMLEEGPWDASAAGRRLVALSDHVLAQLAFGGEFGTGLTAYGAPLAMRARCADGD